MAKNRLTKVSTILQEFLTHQSAAGYVLMGVALISIVCSNFSWGSQYQHFWQLEFGLTNSSIHLKHSIVDWINDGFMSLFFLLVGIEIKRELVDGELKDLKSAMWPVWGALGGMIFPALIYLFVNSVNSGNLNGFGVPMATDIAFVIAVLGLLGDKIPSSLKVFLTALAIIDDLGAIVVIALFYGGQIHWIWLGASFVLSGIIWLLGKRSHAAWMSYGILGLMLWFTLLHSGIHATLSGVILAFLLPRSTQKTLTMTNSIEHFLQKPVSWIILPLFAMSNTALSMGEFHWQALGNSISLGIVLGLFLGKPLGIMVGSWLSVRLKIAQIPKEVTWTQILGAGVLGGIGFTMSIFITNLAFQEQQLIELSKFSIILGTLLSIILGLLILWPRIPSK